MRKAIVFYYRDKGIHLYREPRRTPPKTLHRDMLRVVIAVNELKACMFDPSGRLSALHAIDRLNKTK